MNFWEKVKRDLKKGIEGIDLDKIRGEVQLGVREGLKAVRKGTTAVKEKAEELTEEGKRRYKMFELRSKVRSWMTELGGRVYELSSKEKNPMLDMKVKLMVSRIRKLEAQINRVQGKSKLPPAKKGKGRKEA